MRFRTFASVVLAFAAVFGFVGLFYANRALLGQPFMVWPGRLLPLYAVLGLSFLLGLTVMLAASLARESRNALDRWRAGRRSRRTQALDKLYARGVESMLAGRPAKALEHLRAVLSRNPNRFDAILKTGEVLRSLGRPEEAAELHLQAHRLAPDDLGPLYELVSDAESRHDVATARFYLDRIVKLRPHAALSAWRRLREIHIREEDWGRASEIQEWIDRIRAAGSPEEVADERVRQGLDYQLATQLHRTGADKEAEVRLKKLLKDSPRFVPAWRTLGEVRLKMGNPENAVATWLEGYEKTRAPVLLGRLEDHFLERERPERAIEVFRRAVASASPDTVPRFYLGKLYYRLEMLDEALAEFSALQDRASYTPTLSYYLAKIHERRGRYAEANAQYRRIVRDRELLSSQFRCLTCGREADAWAERCPRCGEWNSVEVDFKEDVSLEDLGISTAPVYSAPRS